jgi:putative ABC transport system substrate-binding protein
MRLARLAPLATLILALLAAALDAEAQPAGKVYRVGLLAFSPPDPSLDGALRQGLRDLGYIEGRNLVVETRSADGQLTRLADRAAELVALNVDLIVAVGTPATLAAKRATGTIPIVFPAAADAVGSGLVDSLARPGSNVTGFSFLGPELVGKALEVLKEAIPGITRVAVIWQPGGHGERAQKDMLHVAEVAARTLALRLQFVEARDRDDLDRAFADMAKTRPSAVVVLTSLMLFVEHKRLVDLAAKHRLPTIYPWREPVDAGGLMAYGPSIPDMFRNAATYVHRILNGARPADLPVAQPTKFEFVINLKTAKVLGLTIPQSALGRADALIQ